MNKYREYLLKGQWQTSIPLLLTSSFLYTIGVSIFLFNANSFPTGTGAFAQVIVYIFNLNPGTFAWILTGFNVPFFIIFWRKCGRKFMIYTFIWIVFQFSWSEVLFSFPIFVDSNPFNLRVINYAGYVFASTGRVIYGLAGALVVGFSVGISYLAGGSTAGTDVLVYYLCKKHKKSIGIFETIIGISTVVSAILINFFVGMVKNVPAHPNSAFKLIFGITTFITIVYICLTSYVMNVIYPRHKKVELSISSNKIEEIYTYLHTSNFPHAFGIRDERSLYSKRNNEIIKTVVLYLETFEIVEHINEIDENAWITITFIKKLSGNFEDNQI